MAKKLIRTVVGVALFAAAAVGVAASAEDPGWGLGTQVTTAAPDPGWEMPDPGWELAPQTVQGDPGWGSVPRTLPDPGWGAAPAADPGWGSAQA